MMETVSEPENLDLSDKQGIRRVHGRLFANYSHNHATLTTKRHFIESTKMEMASNMSDPKRLVYK